MNKFKSIDQFGQLFVFDMTTGDTLHRTTTGSILTLLLVPVTLVYAVMRFQVMLGYKESNIIITDHLDYWTQDHHLTTSDHNL